MMGPGKYDDIAAEVIAKTDAEGVFLLVLAGNRGHGSTIKMQGQHIGNLPKLLRMIADDLELDINGARSAH